MRILVTGATGLIGGAVARRLASAGHAVVGLARSDASAAKLADQGYTTVYGDLADTVSIAEAVRGVDAVIHAASPSDKNRAAYDEAATRTIIDALRGTAKRFVYTSGCLLYGATGDTPATEDSPLYPIDLVSFRKALEGEVLAAAADGVHSIVIRPGWVYGNRGGTAMMMYGAAKQHGAARYVGNGKNRWTTVHVDDLADLYLLALEKASAASIFNGAHGNAIPLIEITRAASEGADAEGRVSGMAAGGRKAGALGLRGRDRMRSGNLGRTGQVRAWVEPVAAFDRRRTTLLRPNCRLTPASGLLPQSPQSMPNNQLEALKECQDVASYRGLGTGRRILRRWVVQCDRYAPHTR